ncbi:MAG: cation diffusion facilitator family transporter [Thermoprotei archaeon]|jgi:cation diffusion facilitator family transporter
MGTVIRDPRIQVAFVSLLATLFLVGIKVLAYLFTGSLSILVESLHSSLDLLSTIITLYAVIIASKPPDIEHMYGHGKAENLGGLAEASLLIITSLWVIYEGFQRIINGANVEFSGVAALVMVISLVIDYSRSKTLRSVAKRYESQALEADALHYFSDLFSSGTVLVIILYSILMHPDERSLVFLDSITAILISVYFARSSYILSKRAIDELMDRSPKELVESIKSIINEQNVKIKNLRARKSGNRVFIDMVIIVPSNLDTESAHSITEMIEKTIKNKYDKLNIDMMIHVEPEITGETIINKQLEKKIIERAQDISGVLGVNDVNMSYYDNKFDVRLHIEINPNLNISEAHKIATKVEESIKYNIENIRNVIVHVEPYYKIHKKEPHDILYEIFYSHPEISSKIKLKSVTYSVVGSRRFMDITCTINENTSVDEAHDLATRLENYLSSAIGNNITITIHIEPDKEK